MLGVLVGTAVIGAGVFWMRTSEESRISVLSAVSVSSGSAELVVDIGGEVVRPGVYKLPIGSRIEDALRLAGGLTAGADTNYIEKYLNKAAKVSDGQKLYIPHAGAENAQRSTLNAQVNINSASQAELEGLPGVGPVTAGKIVTGRPYQSISELVGKKIVGAKAYEQIKDQISVW